jgi:hypothetical protein
LYKCMLRIEKNWGKKVIFQISVPRAKKKCTRQRNSLPRASHLALGKEICAECLFLCWEFSSRLSAKKPLWRVFFLWREFFFLLSSKTSLRRVFYLTLGRDVRELLAKPWIPVVILRCQLHRYLYNFNGQVLQLHDELFLCKWWECWHRFIWHRKILVP